MTGRAGAGPAITLSFLLTAIACSFAALCYAELASMIPIAGSAYTYAYATLGELVAWIIGWDLILEYAVSNMAVAVGFSAYFNDVLDNVFGWHIPAKLANPPIVGGEFTGNWFNISALLVLMILTWILVKGVRESASTNNVMVMIKIAAILIFVIGAARRGGYFQLEAVCAQRISRLCLPGRPSSFSPISASIRCPRRRRSAAGRSAICRSGSS